MIIQMDAWNIRERDDQRGPKRCLAPPGGRETRPLATGFTSAPAFVWITVARAAGGRPVISERGFVATRAGVDGLRGQLHAEALRRGLWVRQPAR